MPETLGLNKSNDTILLMLKWLKSFPFTLFIYIYLLIVLNERETIFIESNPWIVGFWILLMWLNSNLQGMWPAFMWMMINEESCLLALWVGPVYIDGVDWGWGEPSINVAGVAPGWQQGARGSMRSRMWHPGVSLGQPTSCRSWGCNLKELGMNSMKLVVPLLLFNEKKTPNDAVTPQHQSQFTPKRKVLRVDHHLRGCIAVESDSRISLLYSNNAAS